MWSTVELREIRVFLTLAEELHFGRAAERLAVTPSSVSQTLRALEARVGGRLFDRTSRRVALTPLGERLLAGMQPAYQRMEQAFAEARESATGVAGVLRLGMYTPVNGGPRLAEIISMFETRHPACRAVVTDTSSSRDQFAWLRRGDIDVLAIRLPVDEPDVTVGPVLSREPRCVTVAVDHPLAARPSIGVEDLADHTLSEIATLPLGLMETFLPARAPSGRPLRRTPVQSLQEALLRVATGELVHATVPSFVEHHYRHPRVVAVPIDDLPPSETALVWLTRNHGARVEAFARAAAEVTRS